MNGPYQIARCGLVINVLKLSFCIIDMEYLVYILTHTGIKPQPKMVKTILAISLPKQVNDLCKFLGMIQYYIKNFLS